MTWDGEASSSEGRALTWDGEALSSERRALTSDGEASSSERQALTSDGEARSSAHEPGGFDDEAWSTDKGAWSSDDERGHPARPAPSLAELSTNGFRRSNPRVCTFSAGNACLSSYGHEATVAFPVNHARERLSTLAAQVIRGQTRLTPNYLAEQGEGFHRDPSGSFLNW